MRFLSARIKAVSNRNAILILRQTIGVEEKFKVTHMVRVRFLSMVYL